MTEPLYFAGPDDFRAWLEANHESAPELLVGFYKRGTGRPSMTWPESVDEALCFGWIDGIRRSIDAERYSIRFTPRRPRSTWSAVNIRRVSALVAEGRMRPAGLRAFEARVPERSGTYSSEQRDAARLPPGAEAAFRARPEAWTFFQAQPAWYRRNATWWVVSARRDETRERRLARLIEDSAAGRTIREVPPRSG